MKSFIFNADDLGLSTNINQGIFACADSGIVKSTSLLVTNNGHKESYQEAISHKLSVGIHLNATGTGDFFTDNKDLLGKDGKVNHAFKTQTSLTKEEVESVIEEFDRQLNYFVKTFGKSPDHINHHHPLYMIPNFTEAFAKFVDKTKLPTRWFRDISSFNLKFPNCTEFGFYDKESLTLKNLIKLLDSAPDGITEVVLHPGMPDDNSSSSYNIEREMQVKVLTNPKLKEHIQNQGYQIITFNEI